MKLSIEQLRAIKRYKTQRQAYNYKKQRTMEICDAKIKFCNDKILLLQNWNEKLSIIENAIKLGISRFQANNLCKFNNLKYKNRHIGIIPIKAMDKTVSEKRNKLICDLFKTGWSVEMISQVMRVNYDLINRIKKGVDNENSNRICKQLK